MRTSFYKSSQSRLNIQLLWCTQNSFNGKYRILKYSFFIYERRSHFWKHLNFALLTLAGCCFSEVRSTAQVSSELRRKRQLSVTRSHFPQAEKRFKFCHSQFTSSRNVKLWVFIIDDMFQMNSTVFYDGWWKQGSERQWGNCFENANSFFTQRAKREKISDIAHWENLFDHVTGFGILYRDAHAKIDQIGSVPARKIAVLPQWRKSASAHDLSSFRRTRSEFDACQKNA